MMPLSRIKPAPYNPRKITPEKVEKLRRSLSFVGFGKPVIVNATDGTIIAGHQRSKSAGLNGLTEVPAFVMTNVSEDDEIRFNQIHNSADIDCDSQVWVPPSDETGFRVVGWKGIRYEELPRGANARAMIHMLFLRYGQFSAAIATQSGEVLSGTQYAVAMHALMQPLAVFYIEDWKRDEARSYLHDEYGSFSYDHLRKNTYIQSFAQKFRLRGEKNSRSALYEHFVIPGVTKDERIFDFGCGQADYLKRLAREGFKITGLEFYYRTGNSINIAAIDKMVDHLLKGIVKRRFDVVICDSVLNSVDSLDAESDVVNLCNLLLKPGGSLFISGRRLEFVQGMNKTRRITSVQRRHIEFLDENGFSALFRSGEWFYQKFHSQKQARELIETHGFEVVTHEEVLGQSSWQIIARKTREIPEVEGLKSVEREFSLPLPDDRRHKYAPQAIEAFRKVYCNAAHDPTY